MIKREKEIIEGFQLSQIPDIGKKHGELCN